jgi:hypothetical protein
MAFQKLQDYTENKYGNKLVLANDGDSAQVIFLYRSLDDVLVANAHYIKSQDFSGYVHCLGRGCPACEKNIRQQTKVFIPVYRVDTEELVFMERTQKFIPQLQADVFQKFPNPSEYVFTITRHGVSGDINTRYEINVTMKNTKLPYDAILSKCGVKLPDHYETIISDMDASKMRMLISERGNSGSSSDLPDYTPVPRVSVTQQTAPQTAVDVDNLPGESLDDLPDDVDFD